LPFVISTLLIASSLITPGISGRPHFCAPLDALARRSRSYEMNQKLSRMKSCPSLFFHLSIDERTNRHGLSWFSLRR
jgi:hypothetical protein